MVRRILLAILFAASIPLAWAGGGTCPSGSNYISLSSPSTGGGLGSVTLSSLGITQCYYIAATGSDSNNGTTESTPWRHAPGMPNFTGSYTSAAGDGIILRGGDTYHVNAATSDSTDTPMGGAWAWSHSGSSLTSPIYLGVDFTWFAGGSFARPILSEDNPISTTQPGSCAHAADGVNGSTINQSGTFIIWDSLEISGNCMSANGGGLVLKKATHTITERIYMHGWSMASTAAGGSDDHVQMGISESGTSDSGSRNLFIVIDGTDSTLGNVCTNTSCVQTMGGNFTGAATGWAMSECWDVEYSIIRHAGEGFYCGNASIIHDNLLEYVFNPASGHHGNVFETITPDAGVGCTNQLAYNNLIRNTVEGVGFWTQCSNFYWFNNVYENDGHFPCDSNMVMASPPGTTGSGVVSFNFFQNTIDNTVCGRSGPSNSTTPAWASGSVATFENNHLIGQTSPVTNFFGNGGGNTQTVTDDGGESFQSLSGANTQGYALTNDFSPQSGCTSSICSTVLHGNNLSGTLCSTLSAINAAAGTACLSGTSKGVSEVSQWGGEAASYPAVTVNLRPSSGAVDIGAFQFSSGGGTQALTVTVTGTSTDTVTDNLSILTGCNGGTSPCSANYTTGTAVTLTASAGSGQSFTGWSGSGCSGTGTCVVTMSAAHSVTATFTTVPSFTLNVTVAGSGVVTSIPSGINCPGTCSASYASGTVVTLTPVASVGNLFINWSTCSFSGTCSVTMSAAESVTANFCQPVAPNYCNNQTAQSTSFSIASGVVTIATSNTFPNPAYFGISKCTTATQLNGQVLLTNSSTTATQIVGSLLNTQNTTLSPGNVSTTSDATCFLQGQGWNPWYTAPFPPPGVATCTNGNGSPGCALPSPSTGWGANPWAYDFAVPCGTPNAAPCAPMVLLADTSTTAGRQSLVPSLAGETNERNISLSDGSNPPNYMFALSHGRLDVFSGHIDPTYCNGSPCFISDVQGDGNAWSQSPINYGLFSRNLANRPGPHQALWYTLNMSPTCGISGTPDCSIAPVLQSYVLTYAAGAVTASAPTNIRAMNTCPGYAHLQVGGGLGVSSQIQIDNFDNHLLVSVEGGTQGSIQHHSVFIFTGLTNPATNLCEEWDTAGYAGTNLNEIQVTASHGGSGYAVGDAQSFTEAAGVCSSTFTISAISGAGPTGPATKVAIASGASSGCYLARGWSTTATSGSGTGLEVDVAGAGASGSFGTYYAPILASACPAGNNTTLTCETPSTTSTASAGIHNCALQVDATSTSGCGGPNPMLGVQFNPGSFSSFTVATNPHLSGHGQPGYAWTGNAANPNIFEHKGLAGITDTGCSNPADCYLLYTLPNSGCAGAPGGVQMHGTQPTIFNDDSQPMYLTSSINSPGVPTQLNPPGFTCAFGQQSFFTVSKPPNLGNATWYTHWYENTNNAVLANGPVENFEGYDNIMACSPDGVFCIVATDMNTNFPGNTGLGVDGGGAAFTGAFSVTLPPLLPTPPAPPLGMFATVKASTIKEQTDEALSNLFPISPIFF